ncbi:MAG: glycosyltransferase, partial [Limisphaerales bacterium]
YRKADALLLPLTEATANNSLLESLACGTPVISNTVGGIPDYMDESCGWLFPRGDVGPVVELIKGLCANREALLSKRTAARTVSLRFDWTQIRKQASLAYEAAIEDFERRCGMASNAGRLAKSKWL